MPGGGIGSIWLAFRGTGTQLQADAKTQGAKAGATASQSFGTSMKKGLAGGLGFGAALGTVGLISTAVSEFTNVLGDANAAAMAEEESVARMDAALRANIDGWDGNTDAIERTLQARMKLGFSDDEQRESLSRLVVATKDVNKALEIQRTAMDLARLKRISLSEASDALIKVEGGQFRALKALGIELKKGATAEDALLAVRKAATGQAEAYANTNSGKLLKSQVKIGEVMEKLGGVTMPLVADGAEAAADAIEGLAGVAEGLDDAFEPIGGLEEVWRGLLNGLTMGTSGTYEMVKAQQDAAEASREAALAADALDRSERSVAGSMDAVAIESGDMADAMKINTEDSATAFGKMVDAIKDDVDALISEAFGPEQRHNDLLTAEAEVNAAKRALAAGKATSAEKAALAEARQAVAENLLIMAEAGETNSQAFKNGIKELEGNIATSSGAARVALQKILDKIKELQRVGASIPVRVNVSGNVGVSGARANSGPVEAGKLYLVNENTPNSELYMPSADGRIITRAQADAAIERGVAGAGGVNQYNVSLLQAAPIHRPSDIVAQLERAESIGLLGARQWDDR